MLFIGAVGGGLAWPRGRGESAQVDQSSAATVSQTLLS